MPELYFKPGVDYNNIAGQLGVSVRDFSTYLDLHVRLSGDSKSRNAEIINFSFSGEDFATYQRVKGQINSDDLRELVMGCFVEQEYSPVEREIETLH